MPVAKKKTTSKKTTKKVEKAVLRSRIRIDFPNSSAIFTYDCSDEADAKLLQRYKDAYMKNDIIEIHLDPGNNGYFIPYFIPAKYIQSIQGVSYE